MENPSSHRKEIWYFMIYTKHIHSKRPKSRSLRTSLTGWKGFGLALSPCIYGCYRKYQTCLLHIGISLKRYQSCYRYVTNTQPQTNRSRLCHLVWKNSSSLLPTCSWPTCTKETQDFFRRCIVLSCLICRPMCMERLGNVFAAFLVSAIYFLYMGNKWHCQMWNKQLQFRELTYPTLGKRQIIFKRYL